MGVEDDVRAVWGVEPLRGLWAQAREALEAAKPPATFRLELPDAETQRAVGELYGRPMWGQGTRISVSKLDEAVRRSRFALGLARSPRPGRGNPHRPAGTSSAPRSKPPGIPSLRS
nr:TIGR02679 domain-containing protein [Saccharopolyspora sp. ASAGF58]